MGVASGYGYQEVGVASGSGWNLWVWLVGGMYGCGYQEVGVVGRIAGGIYGCGYQEVGVVSRRQVWLRVECMGVVIRRWVWLETIGVARFSLYNLYIPTALVPALFCSKLLFSFC